MRQLQPFHHVPPVLTYFGLVCTFTENQRRQRENVVGDSFCLQSADGKSSRHLPPEADRWDIPEETFSPCFRCPRPYLARHRVEDVEQTTR